jgi:hypothetical protein
MSLTGFVYARDHADKLGRSLEADTHTALMVGCFSNQVRAYTIPFPIAHPTHNALQQTRRKALLDNSQWSELRPRYALFGVGVLGPGHRLYEEAKAVKHEKHLEPLLDPLKALVSICDRVRNECGDPLYYPVGDIANQLFYIQGPSSIQVQDQHRLEITELISDINSRLLTVTPEQLEDVENIILIAGTTSKALAIRELLIRERFNIRFLCTDKLTAAEILKYPPE